MKCSSLYSNRKPMLYWMPPPNDLA